MPFNFNYGGIIQTGKVEGVIDPTDAHDAATKQYVDAQAVYITNTNTSLSGKVITESSDIRYTINNADSEIDFFIVDGSVTADRLAENSVITAKIADSQVTLAKIGSDVTVSTLPAPTTDLNMGTNKITAVGDPTDFQDAANKRYVDDHPGTLDTDDTAGYGINISGGTKHVISVDSDIIASRRYVDSEFADLIDSAPANLDTLKELADALNNDTDAFNTLNNRTLLDGTTLQRTGVGAAQRISVVNPFTDSDETKLDGIEPLADVTDSANVETALTAGDGITLSTDGSATVSARLDNNTVIISDSEITVDTEVIASKEYVDLGFVEHDNYANAGVGNFTVVANNSDLDTTSEIHIGTIGTEDPVWLLSFHESALNTNELSSQYYKITYQNEVGYYSAKYHSDNNDDNLEHLALFNKPITGSDTLNDATIGGTITIEHDTDSVSTSIHFGYGLDRGNVGQIEVDTDVIASRNYVDTHAGVIDTDLSAGKGISIAAGASHLINVDLNDSFSGLKFVGTDSELSVDTDIILQRSNVFGDFNGTPHLNRVEIGGGPGAGTKANSSGSNSIAIGIGSVSDSDNTISIGNDSQASGSEAIALGKDAAAFGDNSIMVGNQSGGVGGVDPAAHGSISIGHGSLVAGTARDSIALGTGARVESGNPNSMVIGPNIHRVNVSSASYDDTDTDLTLATSGFVKSYVDDHAATPHLSSDNDGFGIIVDTEGTFDTITVDTDVIADTEWVKEYVEDNSTNLTAGDGIRIDTEGDTNTINVSDDTEGGSPYFPVRTDSNNVVSINTLFGRRIKEFDMTNNRIIFESFNFDDDLVSQSFTPSSLRWDQPITSTRVQYDNNDNFQTEYADRLVAFSIQNAGGSVQNLTIPATLSSFGDIDITHTFSGAEGRDDNASSFASAGTTGSSTLRYQFDTNLDTSSSEYTASISWPNVSSSTAPTNGGTDLRFDAIRASQAARVEYSTCNDMDNVTVSGTLTVDGTVHNYDDTDGSSTKTTSQLSRTFTGLQIYHDSTVSSTGQVIYIRPTSVSNQSEANRTYTDNVTFSSITVGADYPTWFIPVNGVSQTFAVSDLGTLSANGYSVSAVSNSTNDDTTTWRSSTYSHTDTNGGTTVHLVVPSAPSNGFREETNNSVTYTPINGASGTALTLGHTGHTVTNYRVYSFNVQNEATINIEPY